RPGPLTARGHPREPPAVGAGRQRGRERAGHGRRGVAAPVPPLRRRSPAVARAGAGGGVPQPRPRSGRDQRVAPAGVPLAVLHRRPGRAGSRADADLPPDLPHTGPRRAGDGAPRWRSPSLAAGRARDGHDGAEGGAMTTTDTVAAAAAAELHPWNTGFEWPTHEGPFRRLSPDQVRQYDEEGYVLVEDAFSTERLAEVQAAIEPYERQVNDFLRSLEGGRFEVAIADALTVTLHCSTLSRACRDLAYDPV